MDAGFLGRFDFEIKYIRLSIQGTVDEADISRYRIRWPSVD